MSQTHSLFLLCQGVAFVLVVTKWCLLPPTSQPHSRQAARRGKTSSKNSVSAASGSFDQENSNFPASLTW